MKIHNQWHGLTSYSVGHELMLKAEERALQLGEATVLGFEFESTITLGLRADPERDLLLSADEIKRSDFVIRAVDRGGEATLHSPGQLVIYPVVSLKQLGLGVRAFVSLLEEVTIETLLELGVEGDRDRCESGVFTAKGKIAFVGLRIRRGVATHGVALNIHNDVSFFRHIKSCGRALRSHDTVSSWRATPEISMVYGAWCNQLLRSLPLTQVGQHGLPRHQNIGL